MRYRDIITELGLVVPGVNSTCDVSAGEIKRQAAKFGNVVDENGCPPIWTGHGDHTNAKDTPNKDTTGKQTFYGKNGTPANKKAPVVEGLIEGPYHDGRVLPRLENGSEPKFLYRVMSAAEYENGRQAGRFYGRPVIHASDEPSFQFAEPGPLNVLVKIAYRDEDGWRAKYTHGMGVVAIADSIPATQVQMIAKGSRNDIEGAMINESLLIERKTLPLPKGGNRWAREMYGSMICVMHPSDFIRLTTTNKEEYDRVLSSAAVSLDDFAAGTDPDFNKKMYNIPFLRVIQDTGQVKGHEGRHRAARVLKAGGDKFTCVIMFRKPITYRVNYYVASWNDNTMDWNEAEPKEEHFKTREEAIARRDELEVISNDMDSDIYVSDVRWEAMGGDTMKGSPRSEPFKYDKWKAEDMPANFIGEFNKSIVVPTSTMKFAPVKRRYDSAK